MCFFLSGFLLILFFYKMIYIKILVGGGGGLLLICYFSDTFIFLSFLSYIVHETIT